MMITPNNCIHSAKDSLEFDFLFTLLPSNVAAYRLGLQSSEIFS